MVTYMSPFGKPSMLFLDSSWKEREQNSLRLKLLVEMRVEDNHKSNQPGN